MIQAQVNRHIDEAQHKSSGQSSLRAATSARSGQRERLQRETTAQRLVKTRKAASSNSRVAPAPLASTGTSPRISKEESDASMKTRRLSIMKMGPSFLGAKQLPEYSGNSYNAKLDDDIGTEKCLLDPRTVWMGRWDGWVTLLLVFTTYVTPYEVAYLGNECFPVEPATVCSASDRWNQMTQGALVMFFINRIVDLSFFCDMIKTFFVSYFDEKRQEWVTNHSIIALRYLKFWFAIDLVSILPFDMMSFFTSNEALENAKGARLIRLLRLLKLLRILRGARILAKWQDYFGWSHNSVQLGQFLACVLTMIHWCACLLRMVPDLEENLNSNGEDSNWMTYYQPLSAAAYPCQCIRDSPQAEQYVAALYWATMTLTTIGYGDVTMQTQGERVFATLCMIICGAIYAYAIGSICGLITNTDEASQEFNKNSDLLNAYCLEHQLDMALTVRLREFFRNIKPFLRNEHYRDLLSLMSPTLQGEVIAHTFSATWKAVPFFQLNDTEEQQYEQKEFLTRICLAMSADVTGPKEVVFAQGERMRGMYVIQEGVAFKCITFDEPFEVYGKLDQSTRTNKRGWVEKLGVAEAKQARILELMATRVNPTFFGAEGVLMNRRYSYEVRAHNFLHSLLLLKSDLDMILATNEHPNVDVVVRKALVRTLLRRSVRRLVHVLASTPETAEEVAGRMNKAAAAKDAGEEVEFFDSHTQRVLAKLQEKNEMDVFEAEKTLSLDTQARVYQKETQARLENVEEHVKEIDNKLNRLLAHFEIPK
jgi:hypothetical protein